jgi:hypothetical protein
LGVEELKWQRRLWPSVQPTPFFPQCCCCNSVKDLLRVLPEQRARRGFARSPNRHDIQDVWMLHQFRQQLGVSGLRQINEHLLQPLLPLRSSERMSLALIDATDLEAAASGHKKKTDWTVACPVSPQRIGCEAFALSRGSGLGQPCTKIRGGFSASNAKKPNAECAPYTGSNGAIGNDGLSGLRIYLPRKFTTTWRVFKRISKSK